MALEDSEDCFIFKFESQNSGGSCSFKESTFYIKIQ